MLIRSSIHYYVLVQNFTDLHPTVRSLGLQHNLGPAYAISTAMTYYCKQRAVQQAPPSVTQRAGSAARATEKSGFEPDIEKVCRDEPHTRRP